LRDGSYSPAKLTLFTHITDAIRNLVQQGADQFESI
jgi:hypothetical protein